jgi:hypothetical protein
MSYFTQLMRETFQNLAPFSHQDIVLPSKYATVTCDLPAGKIQLHNRFVCLEQLGEIRHVAIYGEKVDIVNLFFYPQARWDLPLFVMEIVIIGKRPLVGVIDIVGTSSQITSTQKAQAILTQAHADFPQLHQADDPPAWYQACRSGLDFFIRPHDFEELVLFQQVYLQVWRQFLQLLHAPSPLSPHRITAYQQEITAYKHQHRDNTPGLPLMQHHFGQEWTHDYLTDYLFN